MPLLKKIIVSKCLYVSIQFTLILTACLHHQTTYGVGIFTKRLLVVDDFLKNYKDPIILSDRSDSSPTAVDTYILTAHLDLKKCHEVKKWRYEDSVKIKGFAPFKSPFNWDEDPYQNRTWQMYYHSFYFLRCALWRTDKSSADRIVAIMKSWFDRGIPVKIENKAYMKWDDHTVALRIMSMSTFLRFNGHQLLAADRKFLLNNIYRQVLLSLNPRFFRYKHNHGMFQATAVIYALGLFQKSLRQEPERKSIELVNEYVEYSITQNGLHKEHSPLYQKLMVNHLNILSSGGFPFRANVKKSAILAKDVLKRLTLPSGDLFPFGDTKYSLNAEQKSESSNFYPCKAFSIDGFSYISLGNNSGKISLLNNYFSATHKHNDNLSLFYQKDNTNWIIDPGMAPYKNNGDRSLCKSQNIHSGPDLRGVTDRNFLTDIKTSRSYASNDSDECSLFAENTRNHYRISRLVKIMNGNTFLIKDKSSARIIEGARFHIDPSNKEIHISKNKAEIVIRRKGSDQTLRIVSCNEGSFKLLTGTKQGAAYFPNNQKKDSVIARFDAKFYLNDAYYIISHDTTVVCPPTVRATVWDKLKIE